MKVSQEITISNIYWNRGLRDWFFREQATSTLEELVNHSTMSGDEVLSILEEQTEDSDIDDVEEDFYSMSVEELAEQYGIELEEDDDEDEDF